MAINRRFINQQQHSTSCGPVALLNVRKWLGLKHTAYRENLYHFEQWGYDEDGMWAKDLSRALRAMKIKYRRTSHASIDVLQDILRRGNAAIVCYAHHRDGEEYGHYVFVDKETPRTFRAWNWTSKLKSPYMSKRLLSRWFRFSKFYSKRNESRHPIIWEIYK
jgi:hypothetical protein